MKYSFLVAVLLVVFADCYSQQKPKKHKYVTFHGNKFEMADMRDESGGYGIIAVASTDGAYWVPAKMNGVKIYKEDEVDNDNEGSAYVNDSELEPLLLGRLNSIWTQLADGDYYLDVNKIVFDKRGRVCYFECGSLQGEQLDTASERPLGPNIYSLTWLHGNVEIPQALDKQMGKLVPLVFYNAHVRLPAKVNGRKVPVRYSGSLSAWVVRVINRQVVAMYCKRCPVFVCGSALSNIFTNHIVLPVPPDASLIAMLDTVFHDDQVYRQRSKPDSIRYYDSVNLLRVEPIIARYGWPGPDLVGRKGNQAVFYVIQHARPKVQEKYLPMLRDAVKNKKAEPYQLAMLEDRVAMRSGKKQVYGSQILMDGEGSFLSPLDDPDNVDKRRAEVGLGPLSEYVESFGLEWNLEEYKKQLPSLEERQKKMHFE